MEGIKHLLECHCILPQYRYAKNPIYHKFVAFSIIDESDTLIPKFVTCNNCGVVHKIFDVCKSEIVSGRDDLLSETKKDDIKYSIPSDLREILESYSCDIATYENVKFILEQKKWGSHMILTRETVDDDVTGKMLVFENHDKFKIETFIDTMTIDKKT